MIHTVYTNGMTLFRVYMFLGWLVANKLCLSIQSLLVFIQPLMSITRCRTSMGMVTRVYMHTYTNMQIYTHAHIRTHANIHTHVHTHMCTHSCVHTHTQVIGAYTF